MKTVETLTPTADTKEVDLANDTLDITRVTLTDSDGDVHVLTGKSRDELDFYFPDWETWSSGLPIHYFYDASENDLILVPAPSSTYATTDALKVWEIQPPASLTSDSSEPFDANQAMQSYAYSIVHWVVAQCWMDDGTPEALAKSRFHKSGSFEAPGEFEKYIKMIRAKFDAPSMVPARIKWLPQGGRLWRKGGTSLSKSDIS